MNKAAASATPTTSPGDQALPRSALITEDEMRRFQELAFQEYGVRLTDEQAYGQATALVNLFDTLLKYYLAFGRQNEIITDEVI